jgi:hypothetical protein
MAFPTKNIEIASKAAAIIFIFPFSILNEGSTAALSFLTPYIQEASS